MQKQIRIVSDVVNTSYDGSQVTPEWVAEYIAGCEHLIVPGVSSWQGVRASKEDGQIVVVADLTTEGRIAEGDYKGDEVSEDFLREYVIGADAYWLAPEVLRATEVTFA